MSSRCVYVFVVGSGSCDICLQNSSLYCINRKKYFIPQKSGKDGAKYASSANAAAGQSQWDGVL